jgi:transposase-like protein
MRYTDEFKRLVIRKLLNTEGQSVRELAADVGMAKSTLWDWQQEVAIATGAMGKDDKPQRDPKDVRRIRELEKKLKKQEKELRSTKALLELQKKVQEIWGDDEDDDTTSTND